MATSQVKLGEQITRDALVEQRVYTPSDSDLDPSFFQAGAPSTQAVTLSATPTPTPLMYPQCTFHSQTLAWLEGLRKDEVNPKAPSTLTTFTSCAKNILQIVGPTIPLESFKNAAMAKFVQDCKQFNWKPATLQQHILVIKLIIASAVSEEGEPLFERNWSRKIINAPRVKVGEQRRPIFSRSDVEKLICKATSDQERILYCFLAGSGLRISETQAVRVNGDDLQTSYQPKKGCVVVRTNCFRSVETGRVKTDAGKRTIWLHSELNRALISFVAQKKRKDGDLLFQSKHNKPLKCSTISDRLKSRGGRSAACHAFRRFYASHLRSERVLEDVIRHSIGHRGVNVTDRYSIPSESVMCSEIERAGLGFNLNLEGTDAKKASE